MKIKTRILNEIYLINFLVISSTISRIIKKNVLSYTTLPFIVYVNFIQFTSVTLNKETVINLPVILPSKTLLTCTIDDVTLASGYLKTNKKYTRLHNICVVWHYRTHDIKYMKYTRTECICWPINLQQAFSVSCNLAQ